MGNIISYFLDDNSNNNSNNQTHEQVSEAEKEAKKQELEKEKNDEKEYKENNKDILIDKPDLVTPSTDELEDKTPKFKLPSNFEAKSDVEFLNTIMNNINDLQSKIINNSYEYIKNLYPDLSNLKDEELINEFTKIATDEQINNFNNLFTPIVNLSREQLEYLVTNIKISNDEFKNQYDSNKTVEKIKKFAEENNLELDDSVFTSYLDQILEIKNESDSELKFIQELKIDDSKNYIESVEILKSGIDLFMDLSEDQSTINSINQNMEKDILVDNLQKQADLNKLKLDLTNELNSITSTISIKLQNLNDWLSNLNTQQTTLDLYSESVTESITGLTNLSEIPEYKNLDINLEDYIKKQTSFETYSSQFDKSYLELSNSINNLKSNYKSIDDDVSQLTIDLLIEKNSLPDVKFKLTELDPQFESLKSKLSSSDSQYNSASGIGLEITSKYQEITGDASEVLDEIIESYKSEIINGNTKIKNIVNQIDSKLKTPNSKYNEIFDNQSSYKILSKDIEAKISDIIYMKGSQFEGYVNQINDSEGSDYYKFLKFDKDINDSFNSATVFDLPTIQFEYQKMKSFSNIFTESLSSLSSLITNFNKQVDLTYEMIQKQIAINKKIEEDNQYKLEVSNSRSIIQGLITQLGGSKTSINEKLTSVKKISSDVSKLLVHETFKDLSNIEKLYPDNPMSKTAQEYIDAAINLKSSLNSYLNDLESNCNLTSSNIDNQIKTYNDLLNKSIPEAESRLPKLDLESKIDSYKETSDSLFTRTSDIINENQSSNDYLNLVLNINQAYSNAIAIDESKFGSYQQEQLKNFQDILTTYTTILESFKESSTNYLEKLNNSAKVIENYYFQASHIYDPNIQVPEDISDEWFKIYNSSMENWNKIKHIYPETSSEYIEFQGLMIELNECYGKIKTAYESSSGIPKFSESMKKSMDSFINEFEEAKNKLSPTVTIGVMQQIFTVAQSSYTGAQETINDIQENQSNLDKLQNESRFGDFSETLTKINNFVNDQVTNYNNLKNTGVSYQYAAKLISYLYGHYYIGNDESKENINNYVLESLIPKDLEDKLSVFYKLCVFTPILPLIWPNGSSEIELEFQKENSSEINENRLILLNKYVQEVLPNYLMMAIYNSNNYEIKNITDANAYDYVYNQKADNNFSLKSKYYEEFIMDSLTCSNDSEFLAKCAYYIDFAHYKLELQPKVVPTIHIYHKILVELSGKQFNQGLINCLPITYPIPMNIEYEIYESVIFSLNRFFSYAGKIISRLSNSESKIGTAVDYQTWNKNTDEEKFKNFILGGQCLTYDDTTYYKKLMNYSDDAGDINCISGYNNSLTNFNIQSTKKLDSIIYSQSTVIPNEVFSNSLEAYFQVSIIPGSEEDKPYVQFINPTEITNLLFENVDNDVYDFANIGISNFLNNYSDLDKSNYICQSLIQPIISQATINSISKLTLSTNLNMGKTVYNYARDKLMNWRIFIPFINYSNDNSKFIPITKINTVTNEMNKDKKDLNKSYIYSIFNINPIK